MILTSTAFPNTNNKNSQAAIKIINAEEGLEKYNGILLSHKRNEIMPFARNMDGPRDYHTKWNKSDKDKYHKISLICGI